MVTVDLTEKQIAYLEENIVYIERVRQETPLLYLNEKIVYDEDHNDSEITDIFYKDLKSEEEFSNFAEIISFLKKRVI